MADNNLKVQLEIVVTDQDIDDIVACAFEGGINYWCDEAKVIGDYLGEYASDQISRGGRIMLYDYEAEAEHLLTKEKFLNGFKKYAKENMDIFEHRNGKLVTDACLIDAVIADMIIQYAIYGEVIYG